MRIIGLILLFVCICARVPADNVPFTKGSAPFIVHRANGIKDSVIYSDSYGRLICNWVGTRQSGKFVTSKLPFNPEQMYLADIDGDGNDEFIVREESKDKSKGGAPKIRQIETIYKFSGNQLKPIQKENSLPSAINCTLKSGFKTYYILTWMSEELRKRPMEDEVADDMWGVYRFNEKRWVPVYVSRIPFPFYDPKDHDSRYYPDLSTVDLDNDGTEEIIFVGRMQEGSTDPIVYSLTNDKIIERGQLLRIPNSFQKSTGFHHLFKYNSKFYIQFNDWNNKIVGKYSVVKNPNGKFGLSKLPALTKLPDQNDSSTADGFIGKVRSPYIIEEFDGTRFSVKKRLTMPPLAWTANAKDEPSEKRLILPEGDQFVFGFSSAPPSSPQSLISLPSDNFVLKSGNSPDALDRLLWRIVLEGRPALSQPEPPIDFTEAATAQKGSSILFWKSYKYIASDKFLYREALLEILNSKSLIDAKYSPLKSNIESLGAVSNVLAYLAAKAKESAASTTDLSLKMSFQGKAAYLSKLSGQLDLNIDLKGKSYLLLKSGTKVEINGVSKVVTLLEFIDSIASVLSINEVEAQDLSNVIRSAANKGIAVDPSLVNACADIESAIKSEKDSVAFAIIRFLENQFQSAASEQVLRLVSAEILSQLKSSLPALATSGLFSQTSVLLNRVLVEVAIGDFLVDTQGIADGLRSIDMSYRIARELDKVDKGMNLVCRSEASEENLQIWARSRYFKFRVLGEAHSAIADVLQESTVASFLSREAVDRLTGQYGEFDKAIKERRAYAAEAMKYADDWQSRHFHWNLVPATDPDSQRYNPRAIWGDSGLPDNVLEVPRVDTYQATQFLKVILTWGTTEFLDGKAPNDAIIAFAASSGLFAGGYEPYARRSGDPADAIPVSFVDKVAADIFGKSVEHHTIHRWKLDNGYYHWNLPEDEDQGDANTYSLAKYIGQTGDKISLLVRIDNAFYEVTLRVKTVDYKSHLYFYALQKSKTFRSGMAEPTRKPLYSILSSEILSSDWMKKISMSEAKYAINEFYARHGYRFSDESTQYLFYQMGYPSDSRITMQDVDAMMNTNEIVNIRNLKSKFGANQK